MNGAVSRLVGSWLVFAIVCVGCTTATPEREATENANLIDAQAVQEMITAFGSCVRAEGFEFVDPPLSVVSAPSTQVSTDEYLQDEDRAQIESVGYGIVDTFLAEVAEEQQSVTGSTDPNAAVYADLDDAEREPYLAAYSRCSEQFPFRSMVVIDDANDLAEDVYNRTVASDQYVSAMATWSDCFAEQTGETFTMPDQVPEILINELGSTYTYEASENLLFDPGPFDIGVDRIIDDELLRALQAKEMEYSQVDFDCQRRAQLSEAVNDAFEKAQNE